MIISVEGGKWKGGIFLLHCALHTYYYSRYCTTASWRYSHYIWLLDLVAGCWGADGTPSPLEVSLKCQSGAEGEFEQTMMVMKNDNQSNIGYKQKIRQVT